MSEVQEAAPVAEAKTLGQSASTTAAEQAALWERLASPPEESEAITAEAVVGTTAEGPSAAETSDRDLVAPQLRELLQPKEEPAQEQQVAEQEALTGEQLILKKLEALEAERIKAQEEKAQAELDAMFVAKRDAMLANVEAEKESLPGFFALEQQDTLVHLVVNAKEGEEVSEIDVAREIEAKARETYEKLHAIYGETQSKEPQEAPAKPEPTISNQLVSSAEPLDISGMSPKDAQAAIWERLKNRG